ncbi:hypothetical protein POPTR_017G065600v4 [Populus trichocarpa]|uniref:Uncharacterized protein n=4 Tax=Populus trichocarpa TaxID=3694 RepID=A0ACC0RPN0_POPTR|nr:hypothetical protein POPTR_017G065600v4 [Populus trichocarpa]
MEAILVDCVNCKPQSSPFHASKRHIHVRTALRRVPFRGTQMAQSRYLIAISCFQMDLLNEVEAALCPTNEPGLERDHRSCTTTVGERESSFYNRSVTLMSGVNIRSFYPFVI